jgi:UDP-N-acetylglucosamine 2-epimerase (non-hydrolysing)
VIVTVVGARPNFMKAAPIHRAFESIGVEHAIVHTGQHYDEAMSKVFFEDLEIPRPLLDLGVGSGTHAEQTAAVMVGMERFLRDTRPAALLVVGDVNSTMAAAIVAAKMGIYCGHVEAGLRSGDWSMPEEVNRVVTDSVADLLLTPSADADENLAAEGCPPESIVRVGNVMIDTLRRHLPVAQRLDVPVRLGVEPGHYAVLTLHRPSNVDDAATFGRLLSAVVELSHRLPVVFPVHPRTRNQIQAAGLGALIERSRGRLILTPPLGYIDFISLWSRARLVLTDSGGLQEETTALGIPCLTLRTTTERPITVAQGTNVVVGTDERRIAEEVERVFSDARPAGRIPELWDGHSAERIAAVVCERVPAAGRRR